MHIKGLARAVAILVLALLVNGAAAQPASQDSGQSFNLVADRHGWLLASNRLFWTDTLGTQWAEITPPGTASTISGVFFRADGNGWLVESSAHSLAVAHTTDNGAHWTTQPIAPPFTDARASNGRASTFFADPQHGFLMLGLHSGSAFRPGILLRTTDGGATWTQAPAPPAGGDLTFLDATHGFMGPGPEGDELYFTSDAGNTWQLAALPAPAAVSTVNSTIALPVFTDATHGALLRAYSTDSGPTAVRYETSNAGATWTATNILSSALPTILTIAKDGSTTDQITASSSVAGLPSVTAGSKLTPGRSSFSTSSNGWVEFTSGNCAQGVCTQTSSLRGTLDGGRTYFSLAPIPGIDLEPTASVPWPSQSSIPAYLTPDSSSVYNTSGVMGFDACSLPTLSQMSAWITASPYRVAGIYIGGANFACRSGLSSLTTSYVSTILGEGWQMIPIWVGPQAPGSSCSTCGMLSTTTATANSQGVTEADSAVAAMAALSLKQGSTIVYDMEAYSYNVTADTAATQAFLEGWVTELHNKGYLSAVYSSNPEFVNWYPGTVTPAIDIIWFAYFFSSGVACGTECQTVFPTQGSFPISSAYWLNNHRARQTSSGFESTYGGVTIDIDEDWVDAAMVTATPNTLTLSKTTGGSVASSTITNANGDSTSYTAITCGTICTTASASFAPTDTVTLAATPSAGLSVSWKGCTSVSGDACTVTVASSETVTASFGYLLTVSHAGAGTGMIASSDGDISCGPTCSFAYPTGTTVTLSATAAANSYFTGWTGCTSTSGSTCTVTIGTSAVAVQPTFSTGATLTVSNTGTGTGAITSSDGDIDCGPTCSAIYAPSTTVTLTAAATANSTFNGWTGCTSTSGATCTITVGTSATAVSASFLAPNTLTVTKTGAGTGTVTSSDGSINCGPTCSASFQANSTVTLTAVTTANSAFNGWTGCTSTNGSTCSVTMSAAESVTATFLPPVSLTVTASPGGTIVSSPAGINCGPTCSANFAVNTVVTLTETPASGYVFSGWSSNCTPTTATACTITATGLPTVTPTFTIAPSFTGTPTSSSLSVAPGATGKDTLNFVTANGWTGTFSSFSCSGQPATVVCTFNPTNVTATSNTTYLVALTVTVPATIAVVTSATRSNVIFATLLLPGLLLPFSLHRRFQSARTQRLLLLVLGVAALGLTQVLTGCAGSSSPSGLTGAIFSGTMTVSYTSAQTGGPATTNTLPVTLTIPR